MKVLNMTITVDIVDIVGSSNVSKGKRAAPGARTQVRRFH